MQVIAILGLLLFGAAGATTVTYGFRRGRTDLDLDMWKARYIVIIIAGMVLCVVAILFGFGVFANVPTHHGSTSGYVYAVETGGVLYKTTRVYFKPDLASTQEDTYCVEDPAIIETLRDYSDAKIRVRIDFTSYFWWSEGCTWDSGSTVTFVAKAGNR